MQKVIRCSIVDLEPGETVSVIVNGHELVFSEHAGQFDVAIDAESITTDQADSIG